MASDQGCLYCGGTGAGVIDDIEFVFVRPCAGGGEEPARRLLRLDVEAAADDSII
jgi:hypothetical protein